MMDKTGGCRGGINLGNNLGNNLGKVFTYNSCENQCVTRQIRQSGNVRFTLNVNDHQPKDSRGYLRPFVLNKDHHHGGL